MPYSRAASGQRDGKRPQIGMSIVGSYAAVVEELAKILDRVVRDDIVS